MTDTTDAQLHTRRGTAPPGASDHGAWDGPTIAGAPDEAVRGGLTTLARGIGTGLGLGVQLVRKAGAVLGVGRGDLPG